MELIIRKADIKDAFYLFELANDTETRKNSFIPYLIYWEDHIKWFTQKVNALDSLIYIVTHKEKNIGVIRFERNEEVIISITVDPNFRCMGFGSLMIEKGCNEFWITNDDDVIAYVKSSNRASIKVFIKAKFKITKQVDVNNILCYKLTASKHEK